MLFLTRIHAHLRGYIRKRKGLFRTLLSVCYSFYRMQTITSLALNTKYLVSLMKYNLPRNFTKEFCDYFRHVVVSRTCFIMFKAELLFLLLHTAVHRLFHCCHCGPIKTESIFHLKTVKINDP